MENIMENKIKTAPPGIKLNSGQQKAYEIIMSGRSCYVQGSAGTGKSELIKRVASDLRAEKKNVLLCAPTGIAARHVGGVTLHAAFGFSCGPAITDGGKRQRPKIITRAGKALRAADVIIIDECSMVRCDYMDAVIASLKKIEAKTGKHIQLVIVGDVRQLPPVVGADEPILQRFYGGKIRNGYLFLANSWNDAGLYPVLLNEIVRTGDPEYAAMQYAAAEGDVSCLTYFNRCVNVFDPADAVQLASYRATCDRINRKAILALPGIGYTMETKTEYLDWYLKMTGKKITDDLETQRGLPENLLLKPGMHIVMTQTDHGMAESVQEVLDGYSIGRRPYEPLYVNGEFGTIESITQSDDIRDAEALATVSGRSVLLRAVEYPIYDLSVTGGSRSAAKLRQAKVGASYQFPFLPAYAMTVHKSQGQTYQRVSLSPDVFCPGQLYVGLSRATSIEGVSLTRPLTARDLRADPVVTDFLGQMFGNERRIIL